MKISMCLYATQMLLYFNKNLKIYLGQHMTSLKVHTELYSQARGLNRTLVKSV